MWQFFFKKNIKPNLPATGPLLEDAKKRLADTKTQAVKTMEVAKELQEILERNHIAERIQLSITGEKK